MEERFGDAMGNAQQLSHDQTRSHHPEVPLSPFSPVTPLFLDAVESDLHAFLEEVHATIESAPSLETLLRMAKRTHTMLTRRVIDLALPDAGFIAKGQREPVIGYKPQLARSGAGFVTGLRLPQGNAPDAKNPLPLVDEVIARTGVTPTVVSVDH